MTEKNSLCKRFIDCVLNITNLKEIQHKRYADNTYSVKDDLIMVGRDMKIAFEKLKSEKLKKHESNKNIF